MIIVYGNDLEQIHNEAKKYENAKTLIYEDDPSFILDELNQMSLLEQPDCIVIDNASFLLDDSKEVTNLITFLINYSLNVICLIKGDKIASFNPVIKSKKVKLIKKTKLSIFNKQDQIKKMIVEFGLTFKTNSVYTNLINKLPANFLLIKSELNKLKMCVQDNPVTQQDVNELVIDNIDTNIFEIVNFYLTGKCQDSLNLYQQMINAKHQPVEILQIMSTQIMKVKFYKIAQLSHASYEQLQNDLDMTPYQIRSLGYANSIHISKISTALKNLYEADIDIKTGSVDPYQRFKLLLATPL